MLRPSASSRRILGLTLAVCAGTGIGFGAYSLGSTAGASSSQLPRDPMITTTTSTAPTAPDTAAPGTPATPLTRDEATALAAQSAPGRVVEVDEDNEPTGLRYEVTLLHDDGTATEVEVDPVSAQITSTTFHDDWDGS